MNDTSPLRRRLVRSLDVGMAVAAFSVLLIAVIWGMVIAEGHAERRAAVAAAVKENSNLAVAYEEHVIRTLKGLDAVVLFLRHEYARLGSRMDISSYIEEGVIDGNMFSILSVVNEKGDIVLSSKAVPPTNYADRAHFRVHRERSADELYISEPVFGRVSGTWQIPMTRRITRPDGGFGGIVVLSVDPGYFTRFYQKAELGERGLVALVGLDGIARARRMGPVVSFGGDLSRSRLLEERSRAPVGSFLDPGSREDAPRHVSYRTLPDYPLVVAVGAAEEEVLAEYAQGRRRDYLLNALVTIVVLAFAVLLSRAISRHKRASAALAVSEARFRATFERAAIGIAQISLDGRFLEVNQKFCDMLGYTRDELLGMAPEHLAVAGDEENEEERIKRLLAGEADTVLAEKRYVRKDGTVIWGNRTVSLVRDETGKPMYFVRVIEDVTARKRLEAELRELATTDMLTGLPNRRHFIASLDEAHARLQNGKERHAAVLMLDLDKFKGINDTHGHAAGDVALRHFAGILGEEIRKADIPSRLGGEEFAILLPGATEADAVELAERLRAIVAGRPLSHGNARIELTVSIGIAVLDPQDADGDVALRRADAALYRAKQAGRNRVQLVA